jgi:hypothetical protein
MIQVPAGELGVEQFTAARDGQAAAGPDGVVGRGAHRRLGRDQLPDRAGEPLLGEVLAGEVGGGCGGGCRGTCRGSGR